MNSLSSNYLFFSFLHSSVNVLSHSRSSFFSLLLPFFSPSLFLFFPFLPPLILLPLSLFLPSLFFFLYLRFSSSPFLFYRLSLFSSPSVSSFFLLLFSLLSLPLSVTRVSKRHIFSCSCLLTEIAAVYHSQHILRRYLCGNVVCC